MSNINIEFKYKLQDIEDWQVFPISVEQYFDMSLLSCQEISVDSIPLHNNFIDYLDCDRQQVFQICINIIDISTNAKLHFFQTFWNEQRNWLIERIDTINKCDKYHELIISTELPSILNPEKSELSYQVMRFRKKENDIKCVYDVIGFIHNNPNGFPNDIIIKSEPAYILD